ncbi:MAG: rane protein insertase YidC [Sphingomonas bacterium]|uniref:membrane protein insertase YidC n=1 Tax=Sphingomonas bacterium TaxID=1895847 RepID=UPI002607F1CE|nr:membrane protein insertase YidC [Sphingomonas bacterium]MDB5707111.1 rane protein insertase YidC [Sphingomonas bacterium]
MNNDNKNFILFALFAALILFGWPLVTSKFFPAANPPVTKIENGKSKTIANPGASPAATSASAVRDRKVVLAESPRVLIDTPELKGSINLKGARVDDLVLVKYKETIDKNSPPIRLLSPSGTKDAYFAGFGWSGDGISVPGPDTVFAASAQVLSPGKPVTLAWANPTGQKFVIRLSIDDRFMFTVDQAVFNGGTAAVKAAPYALVSRAGPGADVDTWTNHVGPIGTFGSGTTYDITYDNLHGKEPSFFAKIFGNSGRPGENYFDTTGGWAGFGDKYWLAAVIPDQKAAVHSGFRASAPGANFQADVSRASVSIAPGGQMFTTTHLFTGAKEVNTLDRYEDNLHIPHFGNAIDWGWFSVVEKPIFKYLDWLFRMVGNFGVAIILLTLTIRGLMFPIAQRQFASMANMRAIQPKMKALQEKHKDDKPRQQQEIMALYKAEKVNPLAGCLPTFLQIPVFYALYKVLLLTIEMRHQPFVLWIKDLSAPDPATVLNLFGYLHFTLPHFLAIGVIPVLLGISMYFQFKLNPAPMDEAQKQVFAIMPWVLMFVMAPFAVGLQIYWITSNTLTILQQRLLYARHPGMKVAAVK